MPVAEADLDAVRAYLKTIKVPTSYDKVYNDECMLSFDTQYSPKGLFVSLSTWQGFGDDFVDLDHKKTGNGLYLHRKWTRVPKEVAPEDAEQAKPTKLAIGTADGFQVDESKFDTVKETALFVMPAKLSIPLPCIDLPELVIQCVDAIDKHSGNSFQEQTAAWEDDLDIKESKYAADLPWEQNGKKISPDPSSWKCDETGVTENLWLNLSDGFIGSGRRHFDGTGGNNAALRHFEATGSKYPLVVKLGTITPQGADVFSYAKDEDDLVKDPKLAEHLQRWGIDVMSMEKTVMSMAELNVQVNEKFEWGKIAEAGKDLEPLSGPGFVGLKNLGNSCYMNSVLQCLMTMPEITSAYKEAAPQILESAPSNSAGDFTTQMAKLCVGLLSDRYASTPTPGEETAAVAPRMLKSLVGQGHSEFSSNRQQDAMEYLQHLMEVMSRAERARGDRAGGTPAPAPSSVFKFELEERILCNQSGKVKYVKRSDTALSLEIPMERATNTQEVAAYKEREDKRQKTEEGQGKEAAEEPVNPLVPFEACLEKFGADETVDDFLSSATGQRGTATRATRLRTFPRYLAVHMRKYYVGADWTPKKLNVQVPVPDTLSLESLRSKGQQPGEELLPEESPASATSGEVAPARLEPDETIVAQLLSMGFSQNGAQRAAVATKNAGAEVAMEWVFAHMEDPDFNDPLPDPAAEAAPNPAGGGAAVSEESVAMLVSMGFADKHAEGALKACDGNLERAADWLFSHSDDLDGAVAAVSGQAAPPGGPDAGPPVEAQLDDGPADYELLGFVSHMGSNTSCGHYVCHIKKNGTWTIFNDEKVAVSGTLPRDMGYIYFYRRTDAMTD